MKTIYAIVALGICAGTMHYVVNNNSNALIDANIEAIAGVERPSHSPADCIIWYGEVCLVQSSSKGDIQPIEDMRINDLE